MPKPHQPLSSREIRAMKEVREQARQDARRILRKVRKALRTHPQSGEDDKGRG